MNSLTIENVLQWSTAQCYDHALKMVRKLAYKKHPVYHGAEFDDYIFCDFGYQLPILLVAHMDTVDDTCSWIYPKKLNALKLVKNIKNENGVLRNRGGGVLGGDDRAGVYSILNILKTRAENNQPLPAVLFTTGEECGGIGVAQFCRNKILSSLSINLMIELDRRGMDEYVTYHTMPQKVCDYVEAFGWCPAFGIYSDIQDLTEEYRIPSVNVSIGYYHQHTSREYLVLEEMEASIERVNAMLDDPFQLHLEVDIRHHKCYSNAAWGLGHLDAGWVDDKDDQDNVLVVKDADDLQLQHEVDTVLSIHTTAQETCPMCGQVWWNCDDGCHYMHDIIAKNLDVEHIEFLLFYYVYEEDKLYDFLTKLKEWYDEV
jgi:hypothetical protein